MLRQYDDTSATAVNQRNIEMNVESSTVIMMAQPETAFMIMRVINHWISNLMEFHPERDTYTTQPWYIKWTESYPYMRSSGRTLHEIFRTMSRNYTIEPTDTTVYMLVDYCKANIPVFVNYYDIKEYDTHKNDQNLFQFSMNLYYQPQTLQSNAFNELSSTTDQGFTAFNDVHSILSYGNTNSNASSKSQSVASKTDVPLEVMVKEVNDGPADDDEHEANKTSSGVADNDEHEATKLSTGLSLSPNELSSNALGNRPKNRGERKKKKTEDLRTLVSQTCKDGIKNEMTNLRSEISETIAASFAKLSNSLPTPVQKTAVLPPLQETNMGTVPTYRKNMPSPRVQPSNSNIGQKEDSDRHFSYDSPTMRPYQRSGTLNFEYEGAIYELRDGVFNKESANLMAVHTDNDLVQFYQQLQSMVIMYNIFLQEFSMLQPWQKNRQIRYHLHVCSTTSIWNQILLMHIDE